MFDWDAHHGTEQEVAARALPAWLMEGEYQEQDRGDYTDCLLMI